MARCLRCRAGNEWIEGEPAPEDKERIAELERRLEIDPEHGWDGIDARDETIRQLERERDKWQYAFDLSEQAVRRAMEQLAAAQATIQQMRKLARPGQQVDIHAAVDMLAEIYNHQSDRTALDAMLAEAEKRGMLMEWARQIVSAPHHSTPEFEHTWYWLLGEATSAIRQAAERGERC